MRTFEQKRLKEDVTFLCKRVAKLVSATLGAKLPDMLKDQDIDGRINI